MRAERDWPLRVPRPLAVIVILTALFGTALTAQARDGTCALGVFSSRVVAIEGRQLQPLLGKPVSQLRLWAYEGDRKRPIPFQVDARGADGRLLVSALGEKLRDRTLGEQNLLLFVAADAGDRWRLPVSASIAEIEIAKPGDCESRWAYLGRADEGIAPSPRDYVTYDPETDTVHGDRYTVRFHQSYADFLSIAESRRQNTANLIDRWKIRVEARILWGFLKFRRNEEDVTEEVIGYTDGPIRVVRRSRLKTKIGWGLSSPEVVAENYFYGDHYGGPSQVRLPFKPSRVFGDVDVCIYLDFRGLHGFRVAARGDCATVTVGSAPGKAPPALVSNTSWFLVTNAGLGFLYRLRLGPTLHDVRSESYYVDDDHPDPPEAACGLHPGVGCRLTNWASVGRGQHEIWTETYVIDPAKFREPHDGIATLCAPPHVVVHWPRAG